MQSIPFLLRAICLAGVVCASTVLAEGVREDAPGAPTMTGLAEIVAIEAHDATEPAIYAGDRVLVRLNQPVDFGAAIPYLYLNDIRLETEAISILEDKLIYRVERDRLLEHFYELGRNSHEVSAFLGTSRGQILSNAHSFQLSFVRPTNVWVSRLVSVAILAIFLWLLLRTHIIRDSSRARSKPFSLSKTQLLFWVVIVVLSYVYLYVILGIMPDLNQSVLVLLGISASTAAAAKVIDVTDDQLQFQRHKDRPSKGFIVDILSDKNGVSIHRFQNVVFSLVYGLVFLNEVFTNLSIPNFDDAALAVMGLSSVTYAGLKVKENEDKKPGNGESAAPDAGAPEGDAALTGETATQATSTDPAEAPAAMDVAPTPAENQADSGPNQPPMT